MMKPPHARTLFDLLDELAERQPNAPAVVSEQGETVSYEELRQQATMIAGSLSAIGVERGDVVGLLCSNRPEWLAAAFGAARIGATVAAFNTWVRLWDIEHMLQTARPSILITLDHLLKQDYLDLLQEIVPEAWSAPPGAWRSERYPELRAIAVIGDERPTGCHSFADWLGEGGGAAAPSPEGPAPDDTAIILYTSGSTARPKAVPLLHYAMIENGFGIGERMLLGPDDRVWLSAPLFWSYGCSNALVSTFTHGSTLVLQETFDPGNALALIERERCTALYTLPNITRALVTHELFDRSRVASLRTGLTIGLPSDVERAASQLGVSGICNIYGGTETYGNCCVTPTDAPLARRLQSQGPPLPGVEIRIVDSESGAPVPDGVVGEIHVRGYVIPEYLGDAELTAAAFTEDGFFRTGDLGALDEDGWLRFQARATDMIKTGGINVSPSEVEDFLRQHPAVLDAGVVGVPDERLGEVPVAFVILAPDSDLTPDALRGYCKAGIAGFKVPARFKLCEALPRTTTGKLDRRALGTWGNDLTSAVPVSTRGPC